MNTVTTSSTYGHIVLGLGGNLNGCYIDSFIRASEYTLGISNFTNDGITYIVRKISDGTAVKDTSVTIHSIVIRP